MAGINRLIAWWESLAFPWRAWRVIGQVGAGDEVPDRLPAKGVFLVGTLGGAATWAAFDCPCRMGHRLMVNLDRTRHPFWNVDSLNPNPPMDPDGGREDSGRGGRELQAR